MGNEVLSGGLAIGAGVAIGLLLFVPFVALSYRRRGGLTVGRSLLWVAALVYFCAIWTYTLFPLPDPEHLVCVGTNTDLWQAVRDIEGARDRGHPFTDPATLQLALNVLLFVPLGVFIRVLGGRGLPTALVAGAGVSLFVETTQVTGMWWIYDCAYRVFDVDDLVTNTVGAVLGSVMALVVPRRMRGMSRRPESDVASPVTKSRRIVGAWCDVLAAAMLSALVSVSVQLWLEYVADDRAAVLSGELAAAVGGAVPAVVWFLVIAGTGRSIGDLCVELEYRGGPLPVALLRVVRFSSGIGMYYAVTLLPDPYDAVAWGFAALALILMVFTRHGKGLPSLLSGASLVDSRPAPPVDDGESMTQQ
ncbi:MULTISPECIES: VanZ family protein [unclassified Gordonia (in: high G+C Gram-positive bacteria)]|uniref:VanZ family protein n=1 Tax=unclassified Gordonia (in: high G+C Gram-positive bacteria) TaxID=2657482 RepID=UPI001F07038B|nr:VanZ family protein [Gordonia sp. PDNC005]